LLGFENPPETQRSFGETPLASDRSKWLKGLEPALGIEPRTCSLRKAVRIEQQHVPARNVLNPVESSAFDSTVAHGTCSCFVTKPFGVAEAREARRTAAASLAAAAWRSILVRLGSAVNTAL
jgi:hypothetical protein